MGFIPFPKVFVKCKQLRTEVELGPPSPSFTMITLPALFVILQGYFCDSAGYFMERKNAYCISNFSGAVANKFKLYKNLHVVSDVE